MDFVFVGLGGMAGAILRYSINLLEKKFITHSFPAGTLLINILGCFLAGILLSRFENRNLILLLVVGFTGSFTTFSTLMADTHFLIEAGKNLQVFLNLFLSLSLGLAAVMLGKSINH